MTDEQKIKQLEEEIALLEAEQESLTRELYEVTELEIYKTAKSYTYRDSLNIYRTVPLSMITTPFYYRRDALTKKATASFMPRILKRAKAQADFALDYNPQFHFAMFCERIILCSQGIMFVLSDPYRTIQTAPVTTMTEEDAEKYVGKIVIAKLIIPENYQTENYFVLKAIKETNYASTYQMVHEDWTTLRPYLNAFGTQECMNALKEIEKALHNKYPSTKEHRNCYSAWIHDNELRITTNNRLMCFCVKDEMIWYADEVRQSGPTGAYSIDLELALYSDYGNVFENENTKNLPLLMTGEESFEFFKEFDGK